MIKGLVAAAGMAVVASNAVMAETYFVEEFNSQDALNSWTPSTKWKSDSDMGKWTWGPGEWYGDAAINAGMITSQDAKFYGISKKIDTPFSNEGKDLVVQFSVKHEKKGTSFCGGGYIKLLPKDTDQEKFGGDSKYFIMFGPDLCGYDVSRIHLIFNNNGENLLKKDDIKLEYADKDEYTHVYTLIVKPDNTYKVLFDMKERSAGTLHAGWAFQQETVDDPTDKKPSDWVDEKEIADPADVKPAGYDDIPAQVVDPTATKPEDWDDADDGKWEAPMIANPDYKGPWVQKKIDNPAYKGEWKPKQVANPKYEKDVYAFKDIGAVGFELWVVNGGSIFDNIYVGDSLSEAEALAKRTYEATIEKEKAAKKAIDDAKKAEEEAAAKKAEEESNKDKKPAADDAAEKAEEDEKDEL